MTFTERILFVQTFGSRISTIILITIQTHILLNRHYVNIVYVTRKCKNII